MKTIFLLCTFFLLFNSSFAQTLKKTTYLVISIRGAWDKKNDRGFYRIHADDGNPYAADLYKLVWYYTNKTPNQPAAFLTDKKNTDTAYYNYFPNITAALLFMADYGWKLVTVNNEIISGYDTDNSNPYTKITATPLYYFEKLID